MSFFSSNSIPKSFCLTKIDCVDISCFIYTHFKFIVYNSRSCIARTGIRNSSFRIKFTLASMVKSSSKIVAFGRVGNVVPTGQRNVPYSIQYNQIIEGQVWRAGYLAQQCSRMSASFLRFNPFRLFYFGITLKR